MPIPFIIGYSLLITSTLAFNYWLARCAWVIVMNTLEKHNINPNRKLRWFKIALFVPGVGIAVALFTLVSAIISFSLEERA